MGEIFVHDLTVFQGSAPLYHVAYSLNFLAGHCSFLAFISTLVSLGEGLLSDSAATEAHRNRIKNLPLFATVFISAVGFDQLMLKDTYLTIKV